MVGNFLFFYQLPVRANFSEKEDLILSVSLFTLPFLFSQDEKIMDDIPSEIEDDISKNAIEAFNYLGDGRVELLMLGVLYSLPQEYHRESARLAFKSWIKTSFYTWLLKASLGRARPCEDEKGFFGPSLTHLSFPSGHTSTIFALATVLGERYRIKKFTYLLATFTGISRVLSKKHYPSDVLAGALIGYLIGKQTLRDSEERMIISSTPRGWELSFQLHW